MVHGCCSHQLFSCALCNSRVIKAETTGYYVIRLGVRNVCCEVLFFSQTFCSQVVGMHVLCVTDRYLIDLSEINVQDEFLQRQRMAAWGSRRRIGELWNRRRSKLNDNFCPDCGLFPEEGGHQISCLESKRLLRYIQM
jgi:hypothetical protein